jgi:cyclopropane-fatty-acyl-phospholipid synthase
MMFSVKRKLQQALENYRGVPFELRDWEGQTHRAGDGPPRFAIHFRTREALVRSFRETTLGFGEAYARGDVTIDGDLEEVATALVGNYKAIVGQGYVPGWLKKLLGRTLLRQKSDIEHHYGLGNDFYRFYLDKKLQYSCGYFRTREDSLDLAQEQKIAHTAAKLDLRPGQCLLDIGCGWGHLMFHAAETYGVECLGITLCDNQASYIREEAKARNLPVEVRVTNYLELDERLKWDRIVSVGMMCHVGQKYADRYYDKVKALLAPRAVCLLHCIAKMKEAPGSDPFVQKHVFPGYWFFSLEGMTRRAVERGLNVMDVENLRRHYALTAHHWRRNFLHNYGRIKATLGFDDYFMRIWEFYFACVIAGFRTGQMNLIQMVFSNGINDDYPWTREFLYRDALAAAAGEPMEADLALSAAGPVNP